MAQPGLNDERTWMGKASAEKDTGPPDCQKQRILQKRIKARFPHASNGRLRSCAGSIKKNWCPFRPYPAYAAMRGE
jgi:hypothetical protein